MSAAPITRIQVDLPVSEGPMVRGVDGHLFQVTQVSWIAARHGVDVYAHNLRVGDAAIIGESERDAYPHPGLWFTHLATQIAETAAAS